MCGVLGVFNKTTPIDTDLLCRMRDVMSHRGPDGAGHWVSRDGRIGLAHRRLAIVDLSRNALQPIELDRYKVVVAFNGEIYNHRELRKELIGMGYEFVTDHSDTEVLGVGFRAWGIERLLARLNGMFGFVLYDLENKAIYAARDRIGIKPLYLHCGARQIIIASEIKAILAHPGVSASIDSNNLPHHLIFRSLPAPRTLFRGIEKIPPGHWLKIADLNNKVSTRPYWDPLSQYGKADYSSIEEAAEDLESLLKDSVRLRLGGDVPVGTFLSGGIDSGLLIRLATQRKLPHDAFTLVYENQSAYNESSVAKQTAAECGARLHEVKVTGGQYASILPKIAYFQDEPISAPVCASFYFLSKSARENRVPVILAGEGADELFAGYESWIKLYHVQRHMDAIGHSPLRHMLPVISLLPASVFSSDSKVVEVLHRARLSQPLFWGGAMDFTQARRDKILGKTKAKPIESNSYSEIIEPYWDSYRLNADTSDILGWMTYLDLKFRLPELMLTRLDKMTMAHGIEGRVPYLDHRIVEFSMSLTRQVREASAKSPKKILKMIAQKYIHKGNVYTRKKGFQAPVKEWKHDELNTAVQKMKKFNENHQLYDPETYEDLLKKKGDRLYFALLNIQLWYEEFISD